MAIYRSDQASVTFAAEAAQGGYTDVATLTGATGSLTLAAAVVAGATTLTASSAVGSSGTNLKLNVIIGNDNRAYGPREVRRVVAGTGSTAITLDSPLGFDHASGAALKILAVKNTGTADPIAASGDSTALHDSVDHGKYITWFPGVYESVDCPDPEQAFEPRYVLGGLTNRNFYQMYAGNETLTGSIGGMVMLNGFPLRFPIGHVITVPVADPSSSIRHLSDAANKGDLYISINNTGGTALAAGDYILFGEASNTAPFNAFYTGSSVRADGDKVNYEIRQVELAAAGTTAVDNIKLNAPLSFTHKTADRIFKLPTPSATTFYRHSIVERVALDSVSWNVNILDDAGANPWQRRYIGGKIGSMTLSAEAGGLLTGGWDGVNFLDMVHNMKSHDALPTNQPMPRYAAMNTISSSNVGRPTGATGTATFVRPDTAPYYYSQGVIKTFSPSGTDANAVELARIASMSLSITNNPEPKYYVGAQYDGRRAPKEQYEGQREYTMTASIATADSANQSTSSSRNLFKELLLAGDYRGNAAATGFRGFGINMKFTRDIDGDQNDYIEIIIPDDGTSARGGNEQGAFVRAAPHNIGEDSPITADADIVFRNMVVRVQDTEPIYP